MPRTTGEHDPGFEIAQNLARIMKERGVNTRELAQMAGIGQSTVSTLRTGKVQNPGAYLLYRIALALRVPMEDLMGVSRLAGRTRIARAYNSSEELLQELEIPPIDSPTSNSMPGDNRPTRGPRYGRSG